MNNSELASKMLEWESRKIEMDALEADIRSAVLGLGKTQTVGNVRATYSAGRRSFNYQAAAERHPMVSTTTVGLFTTTKIITTTDWKAICEHVGAEDAPFTQGDPSVSIKLLTA